MSSACDSCPSSTWIVPGNWHIWSTSRITFNMIRVSSTLPKGTWSWKRLRSKSTSGQPGCSYASPLTLTMTGSLEKYQLGSFTLILQIEGHNMSTTCGRQQDWPEEDKEGTVIGPPGLLEGQDTITPASTATADSICQKSAPGHISSALVKSARCCPYMCTTNHVAAYAPTSHCISAVTALLCCSGHIACCFE
jgi:hypothetical protein